MSLLGTDKCFLKGLFAGSFFGLSITIWNTFYIKKIIKNLVDRICTTKIEVKDMNINTDNNHYGLSNFNFESSQYDIKKIDKDDFTLQKAFKMIKSIEIPYDREIVIFDNCTPISNVLNTMLLKKCSCGIVKKFNNVIGIIDTYDIASFIFRGGNFETPVEFVVKKMIYVYSNINLFEVAQMLKSGIRYIVVYADSSTIISQGSILRYIHSNICLLDEKVVSQTIDESKLCDSQMMITIQSTDNVYHALSLILDNNITSLPVIENDKCISVLSVSDIKAANDNQFLDMNCIDYIKFSRDKISNFTNLSISPSTVITCTKNDTITTVLETMISKKVHHLYVCDNHMHLEGVVSFVDIIRILF